MTVRAQRETSRAAGGTGGWHVSGCSVAGFAHVRDGLPCQDANRAVSLGGGRHILAVSDGAGSRRRAAEGARLATDLAIDVFSAHLGASAGPRSARDWHAFLDEGYRAVVREFLKQATRLGDDGDPGHFAATLIVAVISGPVVGIAAVGDGFAVVRTEGAAGRRLHLVSVDESGSDYVNQTTFLTSPEAFAGARYDCILDPGVTAVLLTTDGLTPLATRRHPSDPLRQLANPSFLDPVFKHLGPGGDVRQFLTHQRWSAHSGDDKTVLAAMRT
ncbi:PP2C family serine/threonine-protein phosphatase [Solirubrobacter soli]|uniref:PP2C family serine/threonine-protein phosphatase n=1 Tax=Solirubrobacter soli TaxID=363832 RepID=UPI0003FDDF8E|nr:PP2C family serine/threonine-protein phosphatase [Solirubrobacter soli]